MIASQYINRFREMETPFYFYDLELLKKTLSAAKNEAGKYGYHVHFALKANNDDAVLATIRDFGFGADCVSGNEVTKSINLGFPANQVVFAGVGKTDKEIITGLENNIFSFNCESIPEIEVIDQIAGEMGKVAPIAIRINPDVNPKTHEYITTGLKDNKFGINHWDFDEIANILRAFKNIRLTGIHFHIGSQITDISVFEQLSLKINTIQNWFTKHGFELEHINVGGGLGIDYSDPAKNQIPDFELYFKAFHQNLKLKKNQQLHVELGRSLVGQCGHLIAKVLYVKKGLQTNFIIIDAGMNDLIRPMLYKAEHRYSNLTSDQTSEKYEIVGPVCESTDVFAKGIELPKTQRGDLLAIHSTGAYCQVMASTYNMRSLIKAVNSESIFEE